MSSELTHRGDSTRNPLDVITTLKEEVGLRQRDHAHPAFREAVGHLGESIAFDRREADAVAGGETHVGTLTSNGNEIEHREHRRIEGLVNMKIDRTIRVGDGDERVDRADWIRLEMRTTTDQVHTHIDSIPKGDQVGLTPGPRQRHGDHRDELHVHRTRELLGHLKGHTEMLDSYPSPDIEVTSYRGGPAQQQPPELVTYAIGHTNRLETSLRFRRHPCVDRAAQIPSRIRREIGRQGLVEVRVRFRESGQEQPAADVDHRALNRCRVDVLRDDNTVLNEKIDPFTL